MAISFINAATNSNAAGSTSSSLAVNVPTNTANGDIMLACIYHQQNTLTPPGGWTQMGSSIDAGSNIRTEIFYRVASSEPGSYTWTYSTAGIVGAGHFTFRGVNTANPPIFASNTRTTADPFSGPTISMTGPGRVVTYAASRGSTTTEITHSSNSGDTEAADWGNDGGASTRNGAVYYSATVAADDYSRSVNIDTGSITEGVTFTIGLLESATNAPAGTATPSVEANNATVETTSTTINAQAGHASGTVLAFSLNGINAGTATVAVVANSPTIKTMETAQATATAFDANVFEFVEGESQAVPDPRENAPGPHDIFLAEIRRSHTVISYVDLHTPDAQVIRLPAVEGDVKVDRTASIRRTISCRCIDPIGELVPDGVNSVLTPYGAELRAYRGVIYADGTEQVYPLGVFRVSKVAVSDTTSGAPEISVEGFDRSRTVSRDKFTVPYTVDEGTNIVEAIQDILRRTFPELEYDLNATDLTTTAPLLFDAGDDPWEAVQELAVSIGSEIFFDVTGDVALAPPTDMDALPSADFTYIEGDGNTMTDVDQVYSDEPGFNGVIVTGENVGDEAPPVRGEAWDEQEGSVTYRFGPYGEVPMFHQDNIVTTNEEAEATALSLLANMLGFSSQLDVSATVNPTYECGQVVEVVRAASNISGLYVVDAFNVPLKKDGTQSLVLRQKRIT